MRVFKSLIRLLDTIKEPAARAAIVWIIGEYHQKIAALAPDALRTLCKSFTNEDNSVKFQVLILLLLLLSI